MAERPAYEQINNPALAGLGRMARAQVVNAINNALLCEVVDQAGGEVLLPDGFRDRVGRPTRVLVTRFLDDGRYRLWTQPLEPELNHPGAGTRWERVDGPKRAGETRELYEVEDVDGVMATLHRIHESGEPVAGALLVQVKEDYLRRGIGWRRWSPPDDLIEAVAGRDLKPGGGDA